MFRIEIEQLYLINKKSLSDAMFYCGIILLFYCSLHPWPLWNINRYAFLVVFLLFAGYYMLRESLSYSEPTNPKYLWPVITYGILRLCMALVNDSNFISYPVLLFDTFNFYIIFKADRKLLEQALKIISNSFALILIVSIFAFFLYIGGFTLPSSSLDFEDSYSFENYYFFLISTKDLWTLIPRFQSIYLEPSHMAIAAVFLLATQCGKWKRWNNLVLLFSVIISFSLEAYVLITLLIFFSKWMQRKPFVKNLIILLSAFTIIIVGSFFYNDGDNMLNQLIVLRMEIDDGEVVGNNRTTEDFDADYENFLSSSDILWGREKDNSFGNAGYKVFFYDNGLINVILLFIFYYTIIYNPGNKRASLTASALAAVHFVVRAHMLWASCIIPLYYMVQWFNIDKETVDEHK